MDPILGFVLAKLAPLSPNLEEEVFLSPDVPVVDPNGGPDVSSGELGPRDESRLGRRVAVGDFNCDGFVDVASAAPAQLDADAKRRGMLLFLFGPELTDSSAMIGKDRHLGTSIASVPREGTECHELVTYMDETHVGRLGGLTGQMRWAVEFGDEPVTDLRWLDTPEAGAVVVSTTIAVHLLDAEDGSSIWSSEREGTTVAARVRDANDDGWHEVLVGGGGRASVLDGATGTVLSELNDPERIGPGGPISGSTFGNALTSGIDVDRDGIEDYVVGTPLYRPIGATHSYGRIDVFSGADLRVLYSRVGPTEGSFGSYLTTTGDENGDGVDDFLVSDLECSDVRSVCGDGRLTQVSGADGRLLRSWISQSPAEFGASLDASGDIDGDGERDIVVGAPAADADAGRVFILPSSRERPLSVGDCLRTIGLCLSEPESIVLGVED